MTVYNKVTLDNEVLIDLSSDTVTSSEHIMAGYYGHLANGNRVLGTGQSGPSATQHTIVFEFSDETSTMLTGYWDAAFITSAITSTTPTEYGGKTVDSASLDGTAWYTKPTESWSTIYEGTTQYNADSSEQYPYCWISSLSNIYPTIGSVWRVTWNGTTYRCTATNSANIITIGNPKFTGNGTDDGSSVPFAFANSGWGAWSGQADLPNQEAFIPVKIEQLVSS